MRQLLKKNTAWVWTEEHQKEFEETKNKISGEAVLHPFDIKKSYSYYQMHQDKGEWDTYYYKRVKKKVNTTS